MNDIVMVVAVVALLFKVYVLISAFNNRHHSGLFFSLTCCFCATNLFSLLIVSNVDNPSAIEWAFKPQYFAITWSLVLMCAYASNVAGSLKRGVVIGLVFIGTAISALAIGTDSIVSGAESIGYSVTVIKGAHYDVFLLFVVSSLIYASSILSAGAFRSSNPVTVNACAWTLTALLFLIASGLFIALALKTGIKVNASGIVPLGTSLFLLITLMKEASHGLTDFRRFLPFSLERRAAVQFLRVLAQYSLGDLDAKKLKTKLDDIIVEYSYFKAGGSVPKAAKMMGMDRSTVSTKVNKLGLKNR